MQLNLAWHHSSMIPVVPPGMAGEPAAVSSASIVPLVLPMTVAFFVPVPNFCPPLPAGSFGFWVGSYPPSVLETPPNATLGDLSGPAWKAARHAVGLDEPRPESLPWPLYRPGD